MELQSYSCSIMPLMRPSQRLSRSGKWTVLLFILILLWTISLFLLAPDDYYIQTIRGFYPLLNKGLIWLVICVIDSSCEEEKNNKIIFSCLKENKTSFNDDWSNFWKWKRKFKYRWSKILIEGKVIFLEKENKNQLLKLYVKFLIPKLIDSVALGCAIFLSIFSSKIKQFYFLKNI